MVRGLNDMERIGPSSGFSLNSYRDRTLPTALAEFHRQVSTRSEESRRSLARDGSYAEVWIVHSVINTIGCIMALETLMD